MARFILDVANLMPHQIKKLQDEIFNSTIASNCIGTIICIDETNTNQFYSFENGESNELTKEQIEEFNKKCNAI
jgi:hypothetical protein